jgi:hypothetical protein
MVGRATAQPLQSPVACVTVAKGIRQLGVGLRMTCQPQACVLDAEKSSHFYGSMLIHSLLASN